MSLTGKSKMKWAIAGVFFLAGSGGVIACSAESGGDSETSQSQALALCVPGTTACIDAGPIALPALDASIPLPAIDAALPPLPALDAAFPLFDDGGLGGLCDAAALFGCNVADPKFQKELEDAIKAGTADGCKAGCAAGQCCMLQLACVAE